MPTDAPTPAAVAASFASSIPTSVLFSTVGIVYSAIKSRWNAYNEADYARWISLISAYQQEMGATKMPTEWILDTNKAPMQNLSFSELRALVCEYKNTSKIPHPTINSLAKGMLSTIERLCLSISDRTENSIRNGSVEGMFFLSLAKWLGTDLRGLDFHHVSSLETIQRVIHYCEKVITSGVITAESSKRTAKRNNPLAVLHNILIPNLKDLGQIVNKDINTRTYNQSANELRSAVHGMIRETFNLLYLMIEGDHRESEMPIELLLDPWQVVRPKVKAVHEKQLTTQILNTFTEMGITSASFDPHKTVSLTAADSHLKDDFPELENKWLDDGWGHWKPMVDTECKAESIIMANRTILQLMLKLGHLYTLLEKSIIVSTAEGTTWLYDNEAGGAVINTLLLFAVDLIGKVRTSVCELWTPYYADFLQKSITATIKNKDPIQQSLCYGNDHFSALLAALERTDQAITSIRTQITEAPKTKIETIKIKRELLADLLVVTEYMKKEDQVEYSILKAEFNAVIGSQRIRPKREAEQVRARPTEEKQIVPRTFKVAEMSVAMKVKDILEGTTLLGDALTIPKKRTSCEAFQGEIHESVLLPWEEAASRRDLLSVVFFGYQPQDVRNLRRYQSRLNQVLDIIHKELSPLRAARHPSFVVQNDFINEFLLKTLFDMTVDMPWHDAAVKLHKKRSNELAKESLSKFEFSGDMLTVTCPRTLTIDAQECHRRAEARSEEMRVELTEERVRAKKAEQEVEKAKQEAEKAKQEAKIARMEAAGAKKRTGEAEKNEKIARAETTAIRDSLNKIVKLTVENSGPAPQPAPTAAPKTAPAPEARPAAPAAAARPETAKASAGETIASSLKSKAENASTKLHRFSSSMKEGGETMHRLFSRGKETTSTVGAAGRAHTTASSK